METDERCGACGLIHAPDDCDLDPANLPDAEDVAAADAIDARHAERLAALAEAEDVAARTGARYAAGRRDALRWVTEQTAQDRCRTDRDDALDGYDDAERIMLARLGAEVLDTLKRGVGHGCTPMDHLAESAAELGLHPVQRNYRDVTS